MAHRVVVTGIGIVSPIGIGRQPFWQSCLDGASAVAPIPEHWHRYYMYHSCIWAPLPKIDFERFAISRVERMQFDATQLLALVGTRLALDDAGLRCSLKDEKKNTYIVDSFSPERCGVYMGTGVGGMNTYIGCAGNHVLSPIKKSLMQLQNEMLSGPLDGQKADRFRDAVSSIEMPRRFNPFAVPMTMPNGCSAAVSIKFSFHGPSSTPCAACASGTVAIGHAFRAIRDGIIDYAVAGGTEYLADPYGGIFRGFDMAKTLVAPAKDPDKANRPFDEARTGFLFSEGGCGVLILEDFEKARQRGAECLAEIKAFEENSDAFSIMGMAPDGRHIERLVSDLVKQAGLSPDNIDYINGHGTGTLLNDDIETKVLENILGKRALVNSTKSLIGHTIGASGAIEAAVTVLSIFHKKTHPCKNLEKPIRDLNFVLDGKKEYDIRKAITCSFAFGGHNAGLIFDSILP